MISYGSHLDADVNKGLLKDFSTLQDGTFKNTLAVVSFIDLNGTFIS